MKLVKAFTDKASGKGTKRPQLHAAFGTVLAMVFLGEELRAFHIVGVATILAGVILATRLAAKRKF